MVGTVDFDEAHGPDLVSLLNMCLVLPFRLRNTIVILNTREALPLSLATPPSHFSRRITPFVPGF